MNGTNYEVPHYEDVQDIMQTKEPRALVHKRVTHTVAINSSTFLK
jgi:hypothetical protein